MSDDNRGRGAELLLDVLQEWGIECIFGCPGTTEVPILDAMVGRETPRFVLATHEGVAVSAADGYAKTTGQPGVVSLHANVGLANGISNIYSAKMTGAPLVILNAIKQRSILPHGAFTAAHDHQEMLKQYTKWDWTTLRVEELRQDLNRAIRVALQPPRGPTYLALPQDILEEAPKGRSVYPEGGSPKIVQTRPSAEAIDEAAGILAGCKFPVFISGSGVAIEDCLGQVSELADVLGAAVFCENRLSLDYSAFSTDDPHFVGPYVPNHPLLQEADVILALGTKLFVEFQPPAQSWIPPAARLIHVHQDPNEIGKLYLPEVGLCGSTRAALDELIAAVKRLGAGGQGRAAERNARISKLHQERRAALETAVAQVRANRPMRTLHVADVISKFMADDVTVVSDAVTSSDPLVEYLRRTNAKSYFAAANGGSLGWGMGAGVGVKMGSPERKVITVIGDGVFMFGLPALWTAQRYNVPVVFVVINNRRYAAVKAGLLRYGGKASKAGVFPATDISGVHCAQVARGFGIAAETVEDPDALAGVLRDALGRERPCLLEVLTDPDDVGKLAR